MALFLKADIGRYKSVCNLSLRKHKEVCHSNKKYKTSKVLCKIYA